MDRLTVPDGLELWPAFTGWLDETSDLVTLLQACARA